MAFGRLRAAYAGRIRLHSVQETPEALDSESLEVKPSHGGLHHFEDANEDRITDLVTGWTSNIATSQNRFSGWRTGSLTAAALAVLSLLINVGVASGLAGRGKLNGVQSEIYVGNCNTVHKLEVWLHLIINGISTLLLGGSNYCMQCLTAPTRKEVDRAHQRGAWLDIGVPSLRNLRHISWHRIIIWLLLGLTSVPLHLMYNSAFYAAISSMDYNVYLADETFIHGGGFDNKFANESGVDTRTIQTELANFERLENKDCIDTYAVEYLTNRRNLVLITLNNTTDSSVIFVDQASLRTNFNRYTLFDWICSDPGLSSKVGTGQSGTSNLEIPCKQYIPAIADRADTWAPHGHLVSYCLSERVPETCTVNSNLVILVVVILCNAVKAVIMLYVGLHLRGNPLITAGDAIQSFLTQPDATTVGQCLVSRSVIKKLGSKQRSQEQNSRQAGLKGCNRRKRWFKAGSGKRWTMFCIFFCIALAIVGGLLKLAIINLDITSISEMRRYGLGAVLAPTVITGWSLDGIKDPGRQIMASILIANLPQVILSFLYLNLNGLLTCMYLASEWSDFATERKTLRVSTPRENQRSTHFLQLPYRVAIPLMVFSALLHWLVSQGIFLSVVREYDAAGYLANTDVFASCGYSPFAMMLVLILGGVIVFATLALGFRKYNATMPLAGSCSVAISAACHAPAWDDRAAMKPLMWGVIPGSDTGENPGHCCFTSGDVDPVLQDKYYAGHVKRD